MADSLKVNPDMNLLIEGHTDNTGDPAYNMKLSVDRANAVKKVLLSACVSEKKIVVKEYRDNKPIQDNMTK